MALIGMGGSVSDGTNTYDVEQWTLNLTNDVQVVTDTGTGGWDARIEGVSSGELQLTLFYNQAAPQISSTKLFVGNSFTFSALIGASGDSVDGVFLVSTVGVENPAKSPVKVNVTAQSTGEIAFTPHA